jgi:hypothetical protein
MLGDTIEGRRTELREYLNREYISHLFAGRCFSFGVDLLLWGSMLLSGMAAVLSLVPDTQQFHTSKWQISIISAAALGFLVASREARFQQRALWHYKRSDTALLLKNRLQFELPLPPSPTDVAGVSKAFGEAVDKLREDSVPRGLVEPKKPSLISGDNPDA